MDKETMDNSLTGSREEDDTVNSAIQAVKDYRQAHLKENVMKMLMRVKRLKPEIENDDFFKEQMRMFGQGGSHGQEKQ